MNAILLAILGPAIKLAFEFAAAYLEGTPGATKEDAIKALRAVAAQPLHDPPKGVNTPL